MAAFEVIALDTATPQLRAPGASDTYTFPRAVEMPLGTANGVLFLNGSKVVTSGSGLTFNGTNLGIGTSSPEAKLHVDGGDFRNSSGTLPVLSTSIVSGEIHSGIDNAGTSDSGYLRLSAGGGTTLGVKAAIDIFRESGGATGVVFYTSGTEQMRLTSTGLGIGTSSPLGKLDVREANRANSTNITNIGVYTTTAQAADVGGTIGLGGIFDGASGYAPFGSIRGGKENSTVSDYAGYLAFQTIPNGGVLTERLRLKSTGQLRYAPIAADPAGAENGDVYYNSSTNKLRLYAAGAWVDLN